MLVSHVLCLGVATNCWEPQCFGVLAWLVFVPAALCLHTYLYFAALGLEKMPRGPGLGGIIRSEGLPLSFDDEGFSLHQDRLPNAFFP